MHSSSSSPIPSPIASITSPIGSTTTFPLKRSNSASQRRHHHGGGGSRNASFNGNFNSPRRVHVYNHAAANRTPEQQAAMEERVKHLWSVLRSAVNSGTAGWLAKQASSAGRAEKVESAASINEIELPKFYVGDTLPLPSGTIPFVSTARFLRNYLSTMAASSSASSTTASGGHHSTTTSTGGDSSGTGHQPHQAISGSTNISAKKENFAEDRRRTTACKLVLSQHGVGVLLCAFWYMILRRFRWTVSPSSQQQQQTAEDSSSASQMNNNAGLHDEAVFGQMLSDTPSFSGEFNNNNNNHKFPNKTTAGAPPVGSSSSSVFDPTNPFKKAKRATSALVRSFNVPQTRLSGRRAALPSFREVDKETGSIHTNDASMMVEYAQGLIFNAAFHFGQLYAKNGGEMKNPAIIKMFSQMFSASLLNLLTTEFYDAWTERELEEQRRRKRRNQSDDDDDDDHEDSSESDDDEQNGDDENDDVRSTDTIEEENRKLKKKKDKLRKKEQQRELRDLKNILGGNVSTSEEISLEEHVNELCASWFYGDQATDALVSAFKNVANSQTQQPQPQHHHHRQQQHQSAATPSRSSSTPKKTSLLSLPTPLGKMKKKNINNSNNNDESTSPQNKNISDNHNNTSITSTVSSSGHTIYARHNPELFLRKAQEIDQKILNDDDQKYQHHHHSSSNNFSNPSVSFSALVDGGGDSIHQQHHQQELPPRLETRRDFELLQQQNKMLRHNLDHKTMTNAALAISHKPTATDDLMELVHTKDNTVSIRKDDTVERARARFFGRNTKHLEYCRARLPVAGVVADDLLREVSFAVRTRSQLLELGEVLAQYHVMHMAGAKLSMKSEEQSQVMSMSTRSQHPSSVAVDLSASTLNQMTSTLGGETAMTATKMTNAFTPRPEASLQLNSKDQARLAGTDSSSSHKRSSIRCPYCHPNYEHRLQLNVSAMKMGGFKEKQAFKCRSCFQSKAGYTSTFECSRCGAPLCIDCVQFNEVPVVENVLSKAAMSAATKSYRPLVGQLWGKEVAVAEFGPIFPGKSVPPKKPTLDDLGVALGTTINKVDENSRNKLSVIDIVNAHEDNKNRRIQERRPMSSAGTVRHQYHQYQQYTGSQAAVVATPCSKTLTPTTDIHVVNNNSLSRPESALDRRNRRNLVSPSLNSSSSTYSPSVSSPNTRPNSALNFYNDNSSQQQKRQKRLPPLPTFSSVNHSGASSSSPATASSPSNHHDHDHSQTNKKSVTISVTVSDDDHVKNSNCKNKNNNTNQDFSFETSIPSMLHQNDTSESTSYYDSTTSPPPLPADASTRTAKPPPSNDDEEEDAGSGVFELTSVSSASQNQHQLPPRASKQQRPLSSPSSLLSKNHHHHHHKTQPTEVSDTSVMSHCSWISKPALQGRVMRTGSKIDSAVFAADDPIKQHASAIGQGWKNRHVVKMTRIPELTKGNLGRLRSHIQRSLAQARRTVAKADADSEKERAQSILHSRRLREASSRDMIKQFRNEAATQSTRLNGEAHDEYYHRRMIANAVEKYANKFMSGAGGGSTTTGMMLMAMAEEQEKKKKEQEAEDEVTKKLEEEEFSLRTGGGGGKSSPLVSEARKAKIIESKKEQAVTNHDSSPDNDRKKNTSQIHLAHQMLDDLANHPSVGQLSKNARARIIDFVVREKASIAKAITAAGRLKELLDWSKSQGESISVDELVQELEIDPEEIELAFGGGEGGDNDTIEDHHHHHHHQQNQSSASSRMFFSMDRIRNLHEEEEETPTKNHHPTQKRRKSVSPIPKSEICQDLDPSSLHHQRSSIQSSSCSSSSSVFGDGDGNDDDGAVMMPLGRSLSFSVIGTHNNNNKKPRKGSVQAAIASLKSSSKERQRRMEEEEMLMKRRKSRSNSRSNSPEQQRSVGDEDEEDEEERLAKEKREEDDHARNILQSIC